jgi:hypothetical protein
VGNSPDKSPSDLAFRRILPDGSALNYCGAVAANDRRTQRYVRGEALNILVILAMKIPTAVYIRLTSLSRSSGRSTSSSSLSAA